MFWAHFLHIYQPSTQFPDVLATITQNSYRRLVRLLEERPHAKITLNVNGALTELLINHHHQDVIEKLKVLAKRGQIEFTGTAKYHPLLPKLPKSEIRRQMTLNTETNSKYFGDVYRPKGFFSPEMAYSQSVGEVVKEMGFEWMILDGSSYPLDGERPHDRLFRIDTNDLFVFFRDRRLSLQIAFSQLHRLEEIEDELLKEGRKSNEYVITAMDGETFGHHRPEQLPLLEAILDHASFPSVTISQLFEHFRDTEYVSPIKSTWSTLLEDRKKGRIYPRWDNPNNPLHQKQWKLTEMAVDVVKRSDVKQKGYQKARVLLDKAVQSDQFWWASANPCWHPGMVEKGATMLRDVVVGAPVADKREKNEAIMLYQSIIELGKKLHGENIIEREEIGAIHDLG
ncbi:MAG TPA: hypothetical protein VJ179_00420 [Patescibacteria group bacterium]|nr:hypothetical protein [Patescibacteria group bacterium]